MKVLVTFALENEFAPWCKLRNFARVAAGNRDQTFTARVGSADVRVVLTGAGRFAAERVIPQALEVRPDVCIASGLSGGLKQDYRPGDILVARAAADARGARWVLGDPELVTHADASGARVVEKFLVSERVVSRVEEKEALASFGDAVDMESIYVLSAAAHRGIRAVAIRAISDAADSNLPLDFDRVFDKRGAVSMTKVIGQVLRRPHRIAGLMRLAHESQRAAAALADFLDAYVQSIAEDPLRKVAKVEALAI